MKLAEQRAFVRWYDAQPKDPGAAMKRADRSVSTFVSLAAIFGLDPKDGRGINAAEARVSRWRRALCPACGAPEQCNAPADCSDSGQPPEPMAERQRLFQQHEDRQPNYPE